MYKLNIKIQLNKANNTKYSITKPYGSVASSYDTRPRRPAYSTRLRSPHMSLGIDLYQCNKVNHICIVSAARYKRDLLTTGLSYVQKNAQ